MKSTSLIEGVLQIDHQRGVIYFHSSSRAQIRSKYCPTPLRICGLGEITAPLGDRQIDITISPMIVHEDGRILKSEATIIK